MVSTALNKKEDTTDASLMKKKPVWLVSGCFCQHLPSGVFFKAAYLGHREGEIFVGPSRDRTWPVQEVRLGQTCQLVHGRSLFAMPEGLFSLYPSDEGTLELTINMGRKMRFAIEHAIPGIDEAAQVLAQNFDGDVVP
jgi:hypothetical protein